MKDTMGRLQRIDGVTDIESPLDPAARANAVSKDGRSVVVNYAIPGTDEHAKKLVEQPLAAVAAVRAAHPRVRVEPFGEVSASKAVAAQDAKDGKQSKLISNALMLVILLVAFGAVVAAGLPLVLGATAVAGTVGLLGPVSQLYALPADVAELVVIIGLAGAQVAVTGVTAGSKDFNDAMIAHAPIVFAFVLSLTFILLLDTFRSIVVPIKAIVLNLLSTGAAYGILVLVFQDGHGEKLLDFQSVGGIAPVIPLFLFVILFGLSMDYHVFILSRVREAVNRGMSNDDAVAHGLKSTAGVVTSAALVMVAVFGSFALGSDQLAKQIGIGLAAAILIDATIIRAVLLPATMKLLGERNWYLPKRLGWLPKLEHEPQTGAPA